MPTDETPNCHEIARLPRNEARRLLAEAEKARLAEIDAYWALCRSDPERARQTGAAPAAIVGDIRALACHTVSVPQPGKIPLLVDITARLLGNTAIRAALLGDMQATGRPALADAIWDDCQVVALRTVGDQQVLVLRYDGPLFNPDTVPESLASAHEHGFLVCHRADEADGDAGQYESLHAYVIGSIAADGQWRAVTPDLASRNALMRDLAAMEALVERGRIEGEYFAVRPLPTFPTSCDLRIARLRAFLEALCQGDAQAGPSTGALPCTSSS